MFTIALLTLILILSPQTIALTFTRPTQGSTVDLSSTNVTIAWTTNSTDPELMNLFFSGANFGSGLALHVPTSPSQYFWNASDTSRSLAGPYGNFTIFLGSPFNVFAGSTDGDFGILAIGPNFRVKNYPGPTSNGTGLVNTNGGAASFSTAGSWVGALAAVLISAFMILL
jgi:hypothetical protein